MARPAGRRPRWRIALRRARAALAGSPRANRPGAAPPRRDAGPPAPGDDGVPGRWLRWVTTTRGPAAPGEPVLDGVGTDPSEAAAVRAGWLLVDAHERLSTAGARAVFGHELRAWLDYAEANLVPLEPPEGGHEWLHAESRQAMLRYRRTMDFVRAGDRVFDVGCGAGYLAAQLVRGIGVASYHGIDMLPEVLPAARNLFAANGLADAAIHLELGDLFELRRERLEEIGADLVICCEVLEHVDDAERALRVLADALPDGCDLVFSVPLHGRLENVWGHLTVFDVSRLKAMLDDAGLVAHHVEPLANRWTLVVASRDAGPSRRVREATGREPVRVSSPLTAHRRFVDLRSDQLEPLAGSPGTVVTPEDDGWVRCRVTGRGGLSFPVEGLEAVRLHLDRVDVEHLVRLELVARRGRTVLGRWRWRLRPADRVPGLRLLALRPGEGSSGNFQGGPHRRLHRARRVRLLVRTTPGATAELRFRVAYLP